MEEGLFKKLGNYFSGIAREISSCLELQKNDPAFREKKLGEILVAQKVITREELEKGILAQRRDRLKTCALFDGMDDSQLFLIAGSITEIRLEGGEVFIRQDTVGDAFYILVQGRAKVYRTGDYGEKVGLANILPGDSVGEMGYFAGGRRLASVQSLAPCLLLKVTYRQLEGFLNTFPALAMTFLNLITRKIDETNVSYQDMALKKWRTERALKALSGIQDLGGVSALAYGLDGLIERIVQTAAHTLDSERATLFLLDPVSNQLWSKVALGVSLQEIRVPVGRGIAGWCARKGCLANVPDAYADKRFDPDMDKLLGFRTRNMLCGPMRNLNGEVLGVLQIINKHGGPFKKTDESLFKAFAYQTAIAIENFRLYQKLVKEHERMAIVYDISNSVAHTLDLDALFVEIVNRISQALNAQRSSLFLVDEDTGELWAKVAEASEIKEIRFPMTQGLAGYVARSGELLNVGDAYSDPRFSKEIDRRTGFRTRAVLGAPVKNRQGKIIGVTQVMNKKTGTFDTDDEELLLAISSQIAVVLENARLFDRTNKMEKYLTRVQDSISNAIITLDDQYRVNMVNRPAARLFGLTTDMFMDRDIRDVLGRDGGPVVDLIDRVYQDQYSLTDYDIRLRISENRVLFANINVVPLVEGGSSEYGERASGLVLVFEDITHEKRIKTFLTRYMAKDIVERMLDDPERQSLGGVRSHATVVFSDIRGYTTLTRNFSADRSVDFLNEYFSIMVDVIFAHQGVLDKYLGDGMMSVFGIPYERTDDAVRAVRAALDMRKTLADYNKTREASGEPPIRIGIGVCTGDIVSGNIGSKQRMEYTVIGNGVNIASRLENLTKKLDTDLLISESTYEEVKDHFKTECIQGIWIKGAKQAVSVYKVIEEINGSA